MLRPHFPVRFEAGEPILQAIPLAFDLCGALERSELSVKRVHDDPEVLREFEAWSASRSEFNRARANDKIPGKDWQKHYFQGRSMTGQRPEAPHHTRIVTPAIRDARSDKRHGR